MKEAIIRSASVVAIGMAVVGLGNGVAKAASQPNVVGQKYSDAASQLSAAGLSVMVSTKQDRGPAGEHERLAGQSSSDLAQLRCAGGLGDILWQLARKS